MGQVASLSVLPLEEARVLQLTRQLPLSLAVASGAFVVYGLWTGAVEPYVSAIPRSVFALYGFILLVCCALLGWSAHQRQETLAPWGSEPSLLPRLVSWLLIAALGWHWSAAIRADAADHHVLLSATLLAVAPSLLLSLAPRHLAVFLLTTVSLPPVLLVVLAGVSVTSVDLARVVVVLSGAASTAWLSAAYHDTVFRRRWRAVRVAHRGATRDALTDALNRRGLQDALQHQLAGRNWHGAPTAVVLVDVDRFKRINTVHGLHKGDEAVRGIVMTLEHLVRLPAFAACQGVVGRYGGEEFIVVLFGCDLALAERYAEQARIAVKSLHLSAAAEPRHPTISLGCALATSTVDDVLVAIHKADAALYRAKHQGGDRTLLWEPSMGVPEGKAASLLHAGASSPPAPRERIAEDLYAGRRDTFRWLVPLLAAWVAAYALFDVALWVDHPDVPLLLSLGTRALGLVLLGAVAMGLRGPLVPKDDARRGDDRLSALHIGLIACSMVLCTALLQLHPAEFALVIHSASLLAVLSWSLALGARRVWHLPLALVALAPAVGALLTLPWDRAVHVVPWLLASHVTAVAVAIGAKEALTRMRSQESEALFRLLHLSTVDGVTNVLSRSALLAELTAHLKVGSERPLSVALIDLDRFKTVNDRFGHAFGDRVLGHFPALVRPQLREGDLLGRLGGEEFVVLLPNTPLADAAEVAKGLREAAMRGPWPAPLRDQTLSVGLVEARAGEDAGQVLERADSLLRLAKAAGRDRLAVEGQPL